MRRLRRAEPGPHGTGHPGQPLSGGAGRGLAPTASQKERRVSTASPVQSSGPPRRTYVIDTSVLLSDPHALRRFAEHDVILPIVVITELEAKRHHAELGYFARTALRHLDDLRLTYGRLDAPVPVNDVGGTVHVELNHADQSSLPDGFRLGDNDSRILAVALNFAAEGRLVTLVSKDLPMRVKASAVGLAAEDRRRAQAALARGR